MVKEIKKAGKKAVAQKKDAAKGTNKKNVAQKKSEKKVGLFKKISNWIKSVTKEISKVKWPSRKEMIKYSVAAIGFVLFFSLFFYAIELLMAFFKSLV